MHLALDRRLAGLIMGSMGKLKQKQPKERRAKTNGDQRSIKFDGRDDLERTERNGAVNPGMLARQTRTETETITKGETMSKPKKTAKSKKVVVKLTKNGKLTSVKIKGDFSATEKTQTKTKKFPFDKETIKTANKVVEKLIPTLTRDKLMLAAKAKGVKNYRVLNKAELTEVVNPDATQETIDKVVKGAVDRWQAGWGHKGGRVHKIKREYKITKGEQTNEKKENNAKAKKSNV